jgi:hypothetical protein
MLFDYFAVDKCWRAYLFTLTVHYSAWTWQGSGIVVQKEGKLVCKYACREGSWQDLFIAPLFLSALKDEVADVAEDAEAKAKDAAADVQAQAEKTSQAAGEAVQDAADDVKAAAQ